jgi:hypothetical protein
MSKKKSKRNQIKKRLLQKKSKKRAKTTYKGGVKKGVKVEPLPLEQVVNLSFASFASDINSYFNTDLEETKKDFMENQGRGYNFNSGMRAHLNSEEGLKISPPITWKPQTEDPVVSDYVKELYDPQIEEMQLNAFNFLLCPAEDEEGFKPLACCIISSTPTPMEEGSAYLVLREIEYNGENDEIMIMQKYFAGEDYSSDLSVLKMSLKPMVEREASSENVES